MGSSGVGGGAGGWVKHRETDSGLGAGAPTAAIAAAGPATTEPSVPGAVPEEIDVVVSGGGMRGYFCTGTVWHSAEEAVVSVLHDLGWAGPPAALVCRAVTAACPCPPPSPAGRGVPRAGAN